MKAVYTTGDVARICKVSQQTIIRSFEAGELKGYKVPGSSHRRVPWVNLRAFMERNNIPVEWIEEYDAQED